MSRSRRFFIQLAIIVIAWYAGLSYLPQLVGTCFDGDCGFSMGEIIVSLTTPLAFVALPVALEMVLYQKSLSNAMSDIGLTRFNTTGIRIAVAFLFPLLVFYPLFALLTNTPLAAQVNWQWFVLSALLNNGLAEEAMMRGFVFRHLREGRPFWRAAALSTVYFAGYHLILILTLGVTFGVIGVLVAIPAGFLTAYIYERGNNTIWGSVVLHSVNNGLLYVFIFPPDIQASASALYLSISIVVSIMMLLRAYRDRYGRLEAQAIEQPSATSPSFTR